MTEHLKAEVAEGIVVPSDIPPSIPLCVRPMSMVPKIKAEGGKLVIKGWRLVIDASYPGKRKDAGKAAGADGLVRWVAPNHNYAKPPLGFIWRSLGEIGKGAQVLIALAAVCGVELWGQCYDFKGWFRQIGMCKLDRWQVVETWDGKYYHDKRVGMGCSFSADIAQRVSFMIWEIVDAKQKNRGCWMVFRTFWLRRRS